MNPSLSCYILTCNSERRLAEVLDAVAPLADEILVVDSGSTDATHSILARYPVRVLHRDFDNFRDQRVYAEEHCAYPWILSLDSDEVLSPQLVARIRDLKAQNFSLADGSEPDGFSIRRDWFFLGRQVRNFYPVRTPEYIVRLFRKERISTRGSRIIHESVRGEQCTLVSVEEPILHYTCDSVDDLYGKVGLYTRLMAEDAASRGERSSWLRLNVYPWLIWARWYLLYGSWRDGEIGLVLCRYIRITVYLKYLKLRFRDG